MHILYCSSGYSPHDFRFLEVLSRSEYQVSFLAFGDGSTLENRAMPQRIQDLRKDFPVRSHGWRKVLDVARNLPDVIQTIKPDLVHAGPIQSVALPFALNRFHPLVAMSWGSDVLLKARSGLGRWSASYVFRNCDAFLCDSHAVLQRAEDLGLEKGKSIFFPWGVELNQYSPGQGSALRTQLGWDQTTILLSTRNWEPIYGVDLILEGFAELNKRELDTRLILIGDGSMRDTIDRTILSLGLENKIYRPGRIEHDDLPTFYRAADLYLSASHSDGSSVSLLEAMATSLPCVVSDIPGNREWIQDRINGYLFESGNVESLGQILLLAFGEKKAWLDLGRRARAEIASRADWDRNYPQLFDAYRLAMNVAEQL